MTMVIDIRGLEELRDLIIGIERMIEGGDLGRVRSDGLDYNRYVQKEGQQAGIHKGRWKTDEEMAREKETEVFDLYRDYIEKKLAAEDPSGSIREPTAKAVILLLDTVTFYPPPPPNSRYQRTGKLRSSWQPKNLI